MPFLGGEVGHRAGPQPTLVMAAHSATIRKASDAPTLSVVGDLYTFLATSEDTDGRYALFEAVVLPGGGPPPHLHRREVEGFYVLEGEVAFYVEGQRQVAGPGAMFNLPVGVVHAFKNETDRPAKMLIWVAPAGLEEMFQEVGHVVSDRSASPSPPTEADIERLLAVAPRYGIEIKLPQ